jgi:bifunctional non-homologous end joining protein LigD
MSELINHLPASKREKAKKIEIPQWISPMLATLTHESFSDKSWIFERKLDGERCLVFKNGDRVKLMSRNKQEKNNTYPELAEMFLKQNEKYFIADTEVVTFKNNLTSFSKLQKRIHINDPDKARKSDVKVYCYVFDIIYYGQYDLTEIDLRTRKTLLRKAITFQEQIRYTPHRNREGQNYFSEACSKGWEGLIAKRADSIYSEGRSRNWLKLKCSHRQEFVIGGFTNPQGTRIGFGALLIGYYEGQNLKYAGKVGTGYDDNMLRDLSEKLATLAISSSPFDDRPEDLPAETVNWVKPVLVAEVSFTEWTGNSKLRHPSFIGLRNDKEAKDVKREF